MKLRLGDGKSFWIDEELVDLIQLYYDWSTSGRGDWRIHQGRGLYGYLERTWFLIKRDGPESQEKYAHIALKRFQELQAILKEEI